MTKSNGALRKTLWLCGALFVTACGSSSSPTGNADASTSDAAPADAGADGAATCGAGTADPGKLRCGSTTCTTPAEVCCYESSGPRCTSKDACNAGSIECDENTDCAASGAYCCSGVLAVDPGAPPSITIGTFCTTDPTACMPQPGVGNSSSVACQVDSECAGTGSTCIAHSCGSAQSCIRLCSASAGVTSCN